MSHTPDLALFIYSGQTAFSKFLSIFNKLYDHYFPVKSQKLTRKGVCKPWINITLINRMKIRDNLFRMSKRNIRYRVTYNRFRNSLNTQIKDAKVEYFANRFDEN